MSRILVWPVALGLVLVLAATTSPGAPRSIDFTFAGRPVHPKLVEEFESWLSDDRSPITLAVDVAAAQGTDEYEEPFEARPGGLVRYRSGDGWYGYEVLGRLRDGIYVLRTAASGGGSGVFLNLLFLRLDVDRAVRPDGSRYERTVLSVAGRHVLGDRDDAEIRIEVDRVVVGSSPYRLLPEVLDFGG